MGTFVSHTLRVDARVSDPALAFARVMHDLHGSTFDLLDFFAKPWRWQFEYDRWRSYGMPASVDADTYDRWAIEELAA